MANAYRTTANVVTMNDNDLGLTVSDVLDQAPVVEQMAARTAMTNTFKYPKRTANPAVGFRSENDGAENTKRTTVQVTATLGILDASCAVDVAVADAREDGWAAEVSDEIIAHLRQAFAEVEQQVFYGTGNDASGFSGLANQTNLDDSDDAQVVNAGGTTASTASSVWLLKQGPMDVELIWGQRGVIDMGETIVTPWTGATGTFPAYYTPITGLVGLKIGGTYSAVRICNITEDSGKGLTDDLISSGLALFPAASGPDIIVMGKRSQKQLQQSRTATNPTGSPAPFPQEAFGVPIIVSDQISVTESLLTAA